MAPLFTVPYHATDIPAPLPTESEIDDAPDISLEYGGRRIVGVGPYFVVKFGKGVSLLEGENMMFIREITNIPVPRVYALYSNSSTGKNYIVMERVHGDTLTSLWLQLDPFEKESIMKTVKGYFDELRCLPPPNYYGSLDNRGLLDEIFWTQEADTAINGPFTSEDSLNEAFALKYIHDGRPPYRAEFYRQCLPLVFHDHQPVFTHGDFQRKNMMVQRETGDGSAGDNQKMRVVILDWEKSGWYPSYWEYCLAVCALRWDDDWCLWVDKALDPFASEVAWLQTLRLELWS